MVAQVRLKHFIIKQEKVRYYLLVGTRWSYSLYWWTVSKQVYALHPFKMTFDKKILELSNLSTNESLQLFAPFNVDTEPNKCKMYNVNNTEFLQVLMN